MFSLTINSSVSVRTRTNIITDQNTVDCLIINTNTTVLTRIRQTSIQSRSAVNATVVSWAIASGAICIAHSTVLTRDLTTNEKFALWSTKSLGTLAECCFAKSCASAAIEALESKTRVDFVLTVNAIVRVRAHAWVEIDWSYTGGIVLTWIRWAAIYDSLTAKNYKLIVKICYRWDFIENEKLWFTLFQNNLEHMCTYSLLVLLWCMFQRSHMAYWPNKSPTLSHSLLQHIQADIDKCIHLDLFDWRD